MLKRSLCVVALSALTLLTHATSSSQAPSLEAGFAQVPNSHRPWCYWWWINGHVDKASITADLEAMKHLGFGGVLHFDSRGYWDDDNHLRLPKAEVAFMSSKWQELIIHAIREAARLGLSFSMNMSSSGGKLDGPWLVGKDAPKRLVYRLYPAGATATDTPNLPYYSDITTCDVWYTGPELPITEQWLNGGDGLFTMSAGTGAKLDQKQDTPRLLATATTPGARCVRVRFGYTVLEGHDHDVDVLDPQAITGHFHRFQTTLMAQIPELIGRNKTLTHLYSVSWEGSMPTWTGNFISEFRKYTGRDIIPSLPLLAGFTHPDAQFQESFIRDYRKARNDMFRENFYGTMRRLAHERQVDWYSESGGPWSRKPEVFREADQIEFLAVNDMPQGEFWPLFRPKPGNIGTYHLRPTVSTAHLFGLPRASAEAFTHMRYHWSIDPARLKPVGDIAFADGINHFVWHTFTASPDSYGAPGIEYFAGTHINRNVTWHDSLEPFIRYIGRCQWLLQQGIPQVDYAVYTGSTPYQHFGRYLEKPHDHSNLQLPKGYTYDLLNDTALLTRAQYDATTKRLTFPGGVSYGAIVVDLEDPTREIKPEVAQTFQSLREKGFPVLTAEEVTSGAKISPLPPDFTTPDNFAVAHRFLPDLKTHIYFICGEGKSDVVLRATAPAVELWDAVTGMRRRIDAQSTADGRTRISLDLPEGGSVFVLFRPHSDLPTSCLAKKPTPKSIDSEWQVTFTYPKGITNTPPPSLTTRQLRDWTQVTDLKYFSGSGEYKTTINLTAEEAKRLSKIAIGKLPSGVAEVCVNGTNCGVIWCAPWTADATFRPGENTITIRVTNNWRNRLIGDCFLPPEQRITRSNLHYWTTPRTGDLSNMWLIRPRVYSGYTTHDALEPSGLLGPVVLE